ncbi:alpha/beta hydrolase [Pseudoalteromonas ruthenica]|uniref:alpha/beta hydrolase n=1 Tax=Pseudoalteromonas ruthenica TaxID=151081 RepID=UPI00034D48CF|nr:alpha/beta fold hydrolase [Pseudoalteromonas ruthenica]
MRIVIFMLMLISGVGHSSETCLDIVTDVDTIMAAKEQGRYRYAIGDGQAAVNISDNPSFATYLRRANQWLKTHNPRAHTPCPVNTATVQLLQQQQQLPANTQVHHLLSPFELRQHNNDKVALLFHGLTDSPFSYHSLAAYFYRQGFTVQTVLLPGHGSAAAQLQDTEFSQWQQLARYAINRAANEFEQVVIGGYSTGAALAMAELVAEPDRANIRALMLWSPASEPHNKNGWLAKWIDRVPFVNWIDKDADIDFAKYESFPFAAAALAHQAMSRISQDALTEAELPNIPLFVVQSEVDTTIDARATLNMLKVWHDPQKRPQTRHDMLVFYGQQQAAKALLGAAFDIRSYSCQRGQPPCEDVIDISHIGVVNAPQHPYYGRQGLYRNCGSYLEDDDRYRQCKVGEVIVGERTAANLSQQRPLKRLTYNPFYAQLEQDMSAFLARVMQ